MKLKEFKQLLSASECEDIKKGLCSIENQGTDYYLMYDYDKLEVKRKRDYAYKVNVLDPLDQLIENASNNEGYKEFIRIGEERGLRKVGAWSKVS